MLISDIELAKVSKQLLRWHGTGALQSPWASLFLSRKPCEFVIIYRLWTLVDRGPTVFHSSTVMMPAPRPQLLPWRWHHTGAREVTGNEQDTHSRWQNNTQHAEATRDWGGEAKKGVRRNQEEHDCIVSVTLAQAVGAIINTRQQERKICKVKCSWSKRN